MPVDMYRHMVKFNTSIHAVIVHWRVKRKTTEEIVTNMRTVNSKHITYHRQCSSAALL